MSIKGFTNVDMQILTKGVALKYFHKPFTNYAYLANPHQRGVVGGYFDKCSNNIFVKGKFLKLYGFPVFIDLIKHELCHYFIWKSGNHKEVHGKIFNNLLRKVSGLRFAPRLTKGKPTAIYFCSKCHQSYIYGYKLDTQKHHCKRCGGTLKCFYINKSAYYRLANLKRQRKIREQKRAKIMKNATPKQRAFMKVFLNDESLF